MKAAADEAQHDPAWLEEARPRLRPAVRVGPPLRRGPATVHIVADTETLAYVQVGPREAFLMARLDGKRSLAQIGVEYAERFGRRLAVEHWQQLLSLLAVRGLVEPADPAQLERIRTEVALARRSHGRSPLLWRMPIPRVAELVPSIARWTGWLLNPFVAVPLALAGVAVCVLVARDWATLYAAVRQGPSQWSVVIPSLLLAWIMTGCHELGHGVACHRFGGRPTQIGLMWRFPLIALYCKVDDVVTFHRPRHRVMTSFAGVYVNLILLVPVGAWWLWGPDSGWSRSVGAALLLFGACSVVFNLMPVLRLDGYHMLEHATSTIDLQSESLRFTAAFLRHGPAGVRGYPRAARWIYAGYTLLAAAIVGPVLFLIVRLWFVTLAGWWGGPAAALVLLGEALLLAAFLRWALRRRRSAHSAQPREGTPSP